MADDIIYISCSDDSDSTHQRYLREMARLARNERVKRIKACALANPIPRSMPASTNVTITRVTTSAVTTRAESRTASNFGPTSRMIVRGATTPRRRTSVPISSISLPSFARRLATRQEPAPELAPGATSADTGFSRPPCDLRSLFQRGKVQYPPNPNQAELDLRDRFEVAKRTWLGAAVQLERSRDLALSSAPAEGSTPTGHAAEGLPPTLFAAPTVLPAKWPNPIARLAANFNPQRIMFSYHQRFGSCACASSCRRNTCRNSALGLFCNPDCCPFKGKCGNGLVESESVQLVRLRGTRHLALVAREPIEAHVVVGQYLGQLSLENSSQVERPSNEGYRLYLHHDDSIQKGKRVCINALHFGGLMRFANHSCSPVARFHEVSNGGERAIVVATRRRVAAGEEITVDYGADLWFKCRCRLCRDRDSKAGLHSKSCEDCVTAGKAKSNHTKYESDSSDSSSSDDYRKRKRSVAAGKAKAKRRRTEESDSSDSSSFDDYRKRSVAAGKAKRRRTDAEAKYESDDPPGDESDSSLFDDYRKRSAEAGLSKRRRTEGEAKCESDDPPGDESDSSHFDNYRKLCVAAVKAKRRRTEGEAKCESDDPPGDESDNELVTL